MYQKDSHSDRLAPLPPNKAQIETIKILKQLSKSSGALGELKGVSQTIPNQAMLINAIALREAKDSSEIENIITTHDELYKALGLTLKIITDQFKDVQLWISGSSSFTLSHELNEPLTGRKWEYEMFPIS